MALLNSSWNISHKILYWLFKTDRKPRNHVVLPWDRIFFQRYFRFLAVAQNFNCMTNNFPRFQANAEKLDILFYQNIVLYTLKIETETVQCSFLGFRPSGDRVLPLSMSYASQSCLTAWHAESELQFQRNKFHVCDRVARLPIKVRWDSCSWRLRGVDCLLSVYVLYSLRKHPFLLALRRWGRFARRNVCDSYWWRKICPESGQKRWLVEGVVTLF